MAQYWELVISLFSFVVVALAAQRIGQHLVRARLPLISGFLLAGILAGPYVLDLISAEAIERLRFIDEISLAFIAFAAGSELYLKELNTRLKSIAWVTVGNAIAIPALTSTAVFLLSGLIPFMRDMPTSGRIAASLLAGAIMVARSPSSVIAIVDELRARGPFTQTALGVTMVTDVVVIILFAIDSEIADALLTSLDFSLTFIFLLLAELLLSLILGYILGKALELILSLHAGRLLKAGLILLAGYGAFVLSAFLREISHETLPFEILLEPLLICMIGSFVVTNTTRYRSEFLRILHEIGPTVYVAFFTLTGAALQLDVLAQTWLIALALFVVRLLGLVIGSFGGGLLAGEPMPHNRISWMVYVTQAGVGLGLAKEVAVEFPTWGTEFATVIISVIVMSQIIGPPFIKWAITRTGEAHPRAEAPEFDGTRDAIIFGIEDQALAVARQLEAHGWRVKATCIEPAYLKGLEGNPEVPISAIPTISVETLRQLGLERADAIVAMLSDEENYRICELAYEEFGTETIVVRLNDRANLERFHKLGALIVEPSTATVSLLEHFVRSPSAASLLLGLDGEQDIIEVEVRNRALHGLALRDLRLPLDTLILSVSRNGQTLISHGYTRIEWGDHVTVVGSPESLEKVILKFGA